MGIGLTGSVGIYGTYEILILVHVLINYVTSTISCSGRIHCRPHCYTVASSVVSKLSDKNCRTGNGEFDRNPGQPCTGYNPSEYSPISGVYGGVDGAKGAVGNYSKSPASMVLGIILNGDYN